VTKISRAFFLKNMEANEAPPPAGQSIMPYPLLAHEKKLLERVGFLDEKIFYSPEDVDYCLRVWKAGFAVWYEAEAMAVHDAQEKSRRIIQIS